MGTSVAGDSVADLPDELQARFSRVQAVAAQLTELSGARVPHRVRDNPHAVSLVGQRFGRFEVREILGVGGFGVVYRVYDPTVERDVALKVPRIETLLRPEARQRFLLEARTSAKLDHPNIAATTESGEVDGVPYLVSVYCAGVTLAEWMRQYPHGAPLDDAIEITLRLAEAVAHAHSQGVLHRDIKPGNVLLVTTDHSAKLRPKLTDFGLAKYLESTDNHTRTGDVLGTVGYLSPEQASGCVREITTASDIYALGMILYELLTGRTAFETPTKVATLARIINEEAVRPKRMRPEVPNDIDAICLKCLEKYPESRYRSAGELVEDLRRAQRGDPTVARPLTWSEHAWRWGKKRPAIAALAAIAVLLLFTTIFGSAWYNYRLGISIEHANAALARAIASETHAEELLYAAEMKLAYEALTQWDTRQVRQLLDRQLPTSPTNPDRRTFIWHYLESTLHRIPIRERNDFGELYSQAVSKDGRWLAVAGRSNTLRVLDSQTLTPRHEIDTRQGEINAIAISEDGSLIATAGQNGTVIIWKPGDEQPLRSIQACRDGEAFDVEFLPGTDQLITAGEDPAIRFWSVHDGTLIREIAHTSQTHIDTICVAPAGDEIVVIDSDGYLTTVDPQRLTIQSAYPIEQVSFASMASYSPDGTMLAVAGTERGMLIFDRQNATSHYLDVSDHFKHSLAWRMDGRRLFVGDRAGAVFVVAIPTRGESEPHVNSLEILNSWKAHESKVRSLVCLTPTLLVSTGNDALIKQWNLEDLSSWARMPDILPSSSLRHVTVDHQSRGYGITSSQAMLLDAASSHVTAVAPLRPSQESTLTVADNGEFLAVISASKRVDSEARVTLLRGSDLSPAGELTLPEYNQAADAAFSRDGSRLAIGLGVKYNQVRLYQVPSFAQIASVQFENVWMLLLHTVVVHGVNCYLVCDNNELIALRETDLKEVARREAHSQGIYFGVTSPDRRTIYTLGGDGLKSWNAERLECEYTFAGEHPNARLLGISADGLTLVTITREICFWDVRTAQRIMSAPSPLNEHVRQVTFTPDNRHMILTYMRGLPPMVFSTQPSAQ